MRASSLLLSFALLAGCTAGYVGQRERDGGGGGMDGDVNRDAGPDASGRDAGPDAGGSRDGDVADGGDAGSLIPGTEFACRDGMDNDMDGLRDCADPDCDGMLCDMGTSVVRCQNGSCLCGMAPSETECGGTDCCGNGIDDDCDGMMDCMDPACDGMECATGGVMCTGGACPGCPDGFVESSCRNGTDDDCDMLVDCDDPDCDNRICGDAGFRCTGMMCQCPGAGLPEFCEGGDENCNGTIDEGCPQGITRSGDMNRGPVGGGAGTAWVAPCAAGEALIGVAGQAASTLQQLKPICAAMSFTVDTDGVPDDIFTIEQGSPVDLMAFGNPGTETLRHVCPEGFVLRITGDADFNVDSIQLHCGTFTIERTASFSTWRIRLDYTMSLPQVGSFGGMTSPFQFECPPNAVVTGLSGSDNMLRVTRLSATCTTIGLDIR